jgi:hypothetical protein
LGTTAAFFRASGQLWSSCSIGGDRYAVELMRTWVAANRPDRASHRRDPPASLGFDGGCGDLVQSAVVFLGNPEYVCDLQPIDFAAVVASALLRSRR